jgi:hypothetical protein
LDEEIHFVEILSCEQKAQLDGAWLGSFYVITDVKRAMYPDWRGAACDWALSFVIVFSVPICWPSK